MTAPNWGLKNLAGIISGIEREAFCGAVLGRRSVRGVIMLCNNNHPQAVHLTSIDEARNMATIGAERWILRTKVQNVSDTVSRRHDVQHGHLITI